jgi:hypothetical protein
MGHGGAGVTALVETFIKKNNVMPAKAGIPFSCGCVTEIIANDYRFSIAVKSATILARP